MSYVYTSKGYVFQEYEEDTRDYPDIDEAADLALRFTKYACPHNLAVALHYEEIQRCDQCSKWWPKESFIAADGTEGDTCNACEEETL